MTTRDRGWSVEGYLHRTSSGSRTLAFMLSAGLSLPGCGGGGGGGSTNSAALSLFPSTISVTVSTNDQAPTELIQTSIKSNKAGTFYIVGRYTTNGIASVSWAMNGVVSDNMVTFKNPASIGIGTYTDTVTITACYDQACSQQIGNSPQQVPVTYTVTPPQPQLFSVSPASATAEAAAFVLTVAGSQFTSQSVVQWGGSRRTTTFVSSSQLSAQITVADVATAGSVAVTVATGSEISSALPFTIQPLGPLMLSAISPTTVHAGGAAFNVTVFGTGFTSASHVTWNGANLPTTYVSGTTLRGAVTPAQIASTGTATVTVANPASQGGTSTPLTLTIVPASIDSVAYQMNPAHTGAITFQSVTLPTSSVWSVSVGGAASYALIVGGRIFVTISVNSNSELLALDAATGATLWGPIPFAGTANAAYDAGSLFVINAALTAQQVLTALDPATGNLKWSATLGGGLPAPPVASNGIVFVLNTGLVSAFNEGTGATLWQQGVTGTSGTVGVSADGVYSSAPCTTYDLQPLTGNVVWTNNTGCQGGGGSTPVVADNTLYSPTDRQYAGVIFDAETGTIRGNFSASQLPAVTATTAFFLNSSTLQGIARSNNQILWSFAGDGTLVTSPIVVNSYVFVGSSSGNLYALDSATGSQVWMQNVGGAIQANPCCTIQNYTGLAAGDGFLIVPSGNNVTAYLLSANP